MTRNNEPANDNRPTAFDARVLAYLPGLRHLASKLGYKGDDAKELVQDTIVYALSHWQNYREDGGMWNWLYWAMRGVVSNSNKRRRVRTVSGSAMHYDGAKTLPNQEEYAELSCVLGRITGRAGGVLMRRAMGEGLAEIADEMGLSRQRVQQLEVRARERVLGLPSSRGRKAVGEVTKCA